jgi:hypothetical protein
MNRTGTLLVGLIALTGCGYSHIAQQTATYRPVSPTEWVVRVERQMDTVMTGSDSEETQILTLRLRESGLRRRYVLPSADVDLTLEIRRFGWPSRAVDYRGDILITGVTSNQVVMDLRLVVTANTRDGTHPQTLKFRGEHICYRTNRP